MLKADDFSSAFRMRPCRRSEHFVAHALYTGQPARLGLVLGKKSAPRAATRNLVRRLAREQFRLRRGDFEGCDVLIRMHRRYDKTLYPGAAGTALRACVRDELGGLLQAAAAVAAKHRRAQQPAPASDKTSVTPQALSPASVPGTVGVARGRGAKPRSTGGVAGTVDATRADANPAEANALGSEQAGRQETGRSEQPCERS